MKRRPHPCSPSRGAAPEGGFACLPWPFWKTVKRQPSRRGGRIPGRSVISQDGAHAPLAGLVGRTDHIGEEVEEGPEQEGEGWLGTLGSPPLRPPTKVRPDRQTGTRTRKRQPRRGADAVGDDHDGGGGVAKFPLGTNLRLCCLARTGKDGAGYETASQGRPKRAAFRVPCAGPAGRANLPRCFAEASPAPCRRQWTLPWTGPPSQG
jgi:hypothetical protein